MLSAKVFYNTAKTLQKRAVSQAERIGLRFGSFVQRTAKQSIRRPGSAGNPSKPGKAPKDRTGALKNFIRFAYDNRDRSVVVGPVLLPGRTDAQELLEKGGTATIEGEQVNYEARPYMEPALEKRLPDLLGLWDGSIK